MSDETVVRRYDGSVEHAEWCADHRHDGLCLDFLTGWEPAPEQIKGHGYTVIPRAEGDPAYDKFRQEADRSGVHFGGDARVNVVTLPATTGAQP
jgi:hypothetical protein